MDDYIVVGNPVEHSLSPQIHGAFALQTGEAVRYGKAKVDKDGFAEFVDGYFALGGKGLNVTVPFKLDAYAYVEELDETAATAQAVNTIQLTTDLRICGFNTDGAGLCVDLTQRLGLNLVGKEVLLLGAGGAARGILHPLIKLRPRRILIANRTHEKAVALVDAFASPAAGVELGAIALAQLEQRADIVLNSTSSGLSGDRIDLPERVIEGAFCYDLAYGPSAVFSAWAGAHGASGTSDGLGMLVEQAAESFAIWRGVRPATAEVYAVLRKQLDGG